MAVLAAHLVDDVLGDLPVRQWVLTLPHRLRYDADCASRRSAPPFQRAVPSCTGRRVRPRWVP
jgi:hypothetical protein